MWKNDPTIEPTRGLLNLKICPLLTDEEHSADSEFSLLLMRSDRVARRKETKLQILTADNGALLNPWCAAINLSIRHSTLIRLPSQRAHFLASRSVDFEIGFEAETLKKKERPEWESELWLDDRPNATDVIQLCPWSHCWELFYANH